jgi:hypothetical protein
MAQRIEYNKIGNKKGVTHGMSHLPEYSVWQNMKNRCDNKNCSKYVIYGQRGIKYQPSWASFESFIKDVGQRPTKKHTLDRIDTNGNYCKENCRWATNKENCRNKRNNNLINGKTLSEWSEITGIKRSTLAQRFYVYKWPIDRLLAV